MFSELGASSAQIGNRGRTPKSHSLPDDLFQEWINFFPLRGNWNAMGRRVVDTQVHDLAVRLKSLCQQPCLVDHTSAMIFRPVQNQCRRLDLVGVPQRCAPCKGFRCDPRAAGAKPSEPQGIASRTGRSMGSNGLRCHCSLAAAGCRIIPLQHYFLTCPVHDRKSHQNTFIAPRPRD
jgi:hypothetical protein